MQLGPDSRHIGVGESSLEVIPTIEGSFSWKDGNRSAANISKRLPQAHSTRHRPFAEYEPQDLRLYNRDQVPSGKFWWPRLERN